MHARHKDKKICHGHLDYCASFPVEKALPLLSDKQSRKLRACAALNPVGRWAWFTTHHPCKVQPEEPKFLVLPYFRSTWLEPQETAEHVSSCWVAAFHLFRWKPYGDATQYWNGVSLTHWRMVIESWRRVARLKYLYCTATTKLLKNFKEKMFMH